MPSITPAPLTYVVPNATGERLWIHVHNTSDAAVELSALVVNGHDVTDAACVPARALAPGEAALWSAPLCDPVRPGDAWTVVAEYAGAPAAVGVGRVLRRQFPIHAWPSSSDCPVPVGNDANFRRHRDAGFDTYYLYWGGGRGDPPCQYDMEALVNEVAPATPELNVLIGDDFLSRGGDADDITDPSSVAGFLTGDESDGELYTDEGVPKASIKAADARRLWAMYPELTVYNGAKTNGHVGTFAGMADVQGIDFYAAACAPHITDFNNHPPLRGPFDYLRNTRNNHMPGPTWMYAQGLSDAWNQERRDDVLHIQPDPQEIEVQALQAMAAGAKGLMWFQTLLAEADLAPERWEAIADANWVFRAVRAHLLEGDPTGAATVDGQAIVESIRAPRALVVPVTNLLAVEQPDDLTCLSGRLPDNEIPHWVLGAQDLRVRIPVPTDLTAYEVFEVTPDGVSPLRGVRLGVEGRTLVLDGVRVDNDRAARVFVVAADARVRAEAEAELAQRP